METRGISPGPACNQPTDPPGQYWTELAQPGTPQQNNFATVRETSLACGIVETDKSNNFDHFAK